LEPSPSWEASSHSATQEITNTLRNPNVSYISTRARRRSVLSQSNPGHTDHPIPLRSVLYPTFIIIIIIIIIQPLNACSYYTLH
jgi:hypothetical protein